MSTSQQTKKELYSDPKILDAVSQLERTKAAIAAELNPERYRNIVDIINQTIGSLNDADDLIPFQRQVTTQIIAPVTTRIEKSGRLSLAVSLLFGVIGLVTFALSYFQSPVNRLESSLTEVSATLRSLAKASVPPDPKAPPVNDTIAVIYPDDVGLSAAVLGKYIDCKELLTNYLALAHKEEAEKAQMSLDSSLSPMQHMESQPRSYDIILAGAARTPPKQVIVHPYNLAEAAAAVRNAFTAKQLREAWKGCTATP